MTIMNLVTPKALANMFNKLASEYSGKAD
jgi:hypothetical protein